MRQLLIIFAALFSHLANTNPLALEWLQPMVNVNVPMWSVEQVKNESFLYDCGLEQENREYCSVPSYYYKIEVEARLSVQQGFVNQVELTAPFAVSTYTELMLNLRKDGFALGHARLGEQVYDVRKQLTIKDPDTVNREVVLFINNGQISSPRTYLFYPVSELDKIEPNRLVQFDSSESEISITFIRER